MKKKYLIAIIAVVAVIAIALIIWGIISLVKKESTMNTDAFNSCTVYLKTEDTEIEEKLSKSDAQKIRNIFSGRKLTDNMPDYEFSEDYKLIVTTADGETHEFWISLENTEYIFWKNKGVYFNISTAQNRLLTLRLKEYGIKLD